LSIAGTSDTDRINIGTVSGYNMLWLNNGTALVDANFFSRASDTNLYINRPSGKMIQFRENNVAGVTFLSGGNVGIGTTNPQGRLHLNDSGTAIPTSGYGTGLMVSRTDGLMGTMFGFLNSPQSGYLQGANFTNSDTLPFLINPRGGNVGIGTTAPIALLDLTVGQAKTATGGAQFFALGKTNESSGYASLNCEVRGGASASVRKWLFQTVEQGIANDGSIIFQSDGGKVGIGTTIVGSTQVEISKASGGSLRLSRKENYAAMDAADELIGNIMFSNADDATGAIIQVKTDDSAGWAANDYPCRMEFYTTPNNSGDVALALTLDASQNATFAGDVTAAGGGHFGSNSSIIGGSGANVQFAIANAEQRYELFVYGSSSDQLVLKDGTADVTRMTLDTSGNFTFAGTITTGVIKANSGADYPHSFTNTDADATHWTNRGHRMLTSNGTNWTSADGKDPVIAIVNNSSSTERGRAVGLTLHNDNTTNNAFSPFLTFSSLSDSGSYNTMYAYIAGRKVGSSGDTNWAKGQLHFGTVGTSYTNDTPTLLLDESQNATFSGGVSVNGSTHSDPLSVVGTFRHHKNAGDSLESLAIWYEGGNTGRTDFFSYGKDSSTRGGFSFYGTTGTGTGDTKFLELAVGTGNATFGGSITVGGGHFFGNNSNTNDLMIESAGDDIDIVGSWIRMRTTASSGVNSAWHSLGHLTLGADAQTTYMLKVASGNAYFAGNALFAGDVSTANGFYPTSDGGAELGNASLRFSNLYVQDMQMSNTGTGGNDVDGTEGSWTIQEGEDDLFLLNRKNGKKYKFKLEVV
jgi:hypothetical protein